ELGELLAHELERNALVGLNASGQPAGVLLRKEALLNDREQVAVETERSEEDEQDRARVTQRPRQAALIDMQCAGKNALAEPIKAAMLFAPRALEDECAHHRRGCERYGERQEDGDRQRDRELAE